MVVKALEVSGNGEIKNLVECPYCGQKLLNVVAIDGKTKVVVKCRRCRRYIRISLTQ